MQQPRANEAGSAFLITLIALSLMSLLALYVSLNASTGLQISDNYETQIQATYAALAGLNHARTLIRGLALDALLQGPDGTHSIDPSYLALARTFGFRNPLSLTLAHSLNILIPDLGAAALPDDGLISTGFHGGSSGTLLIPADGIGLQSPNPYRTGLMMNSRYFVKVTDNNGEPSEIAGDPGDSPFVDGDGAVIVRSVGLAKTFLQRTGSVSRLNSVAIFEARFKRLSTFDAGPAIVVLGNIISSLFSGDYEISGDVFPGIGTIDPVPGDEIRPDQIIRAAVGVDGNITGAGEPAPSIRDISGQIRSSRDQALLLNPAYLWNFVNTRAARFADAVFHGDQYWTDGNAPYIGAYDPSRPWNAPGQDPIVTLVNGDLYWNGSLSGGGVLIVTGNLVCSGAYRYSGLVLVIGSGSLTADGSGLGIEGGTFVVRLQNQDGSIVFGIPEISVGGISRFLANRDIVRMAVSLIPVSRTGFREIAGSDP